MAGNKSLNKANKAKNDEFYTQLADIEAELKHYRNHFAGKIVLCNCDDPYESNFFKYFAMNFNYLGLKKLICTCYMGSAIAGNQLSFEDIFSDGDYTPQRYPYKIEITEVCDHNGDGAIDLTDIQYLLKNNKNTLSLLNGDGDFRSEECVDLLKQADIVATNPPFSLFREYIAQLMEHDKKFLIIGNQNAITYKEIFPLLKENKMWLGYGFQGGNAYFKLPPYANITKYAKGVYNLEMHQVKFRNCCWFTNLDHQKRHEELELYKKYTPEEFPHYANYDAVNVNKTSEIPEDYYGEMGVPITFIDKYNPDQFEIVGLSIFLANPISDYAPEGTYTKGGPAFYIKNDKNTYDRLYARVVIRRK